MQPVVKPEEISDVLRRTAELRYEVATLGARLREVDGPLATLAELRVAYVEGCLDSVIATMSDGAESILAVGKPD